MTGIAKYLFILSSLLILGCSEDKSNLVYTTPNLKEVEFLQFTKRQSIYMEALATGELVLINSCLKFKGNPSSIVFPVTFYLDYLDGKVVIKENENIIGIEGEQVSTGGGWVKSIEHLPITKPIKCKSKEYFIVGQGFKLE